MVTGYDTIGDDVSRTERLLALVVSLRGRGRFMVQEMADELGVSRRTMLRDLHALSALGVPLTASPGPGGGYALAFPHRMVPLLFSAEEALGLILSYEAFLQHAQSPVAAQSISAITKLRAALPAEVTRELDRLSERVAMITVARTYEAPLLPDLLHAALDGVHLRIRYDSRRGASERVIYPYGLYAGLGFWYCACFDYQRGIHASLRADRILSLERVEGRERPPAMTLQEWLRRSANTAEELVRLRAKVTPPGLKDLDWNLFAADLTVDDAGHGTIDLYVPRANLDFYARRLMGPGADTVVQSPPALVALLRERAAALLACYDARS
jgi:predicted DNA-binding transcriptional regulator YafY